MTVEKQNYAIISKYQSLYKTKAGQSYSINKFKEKWAAQDLIDSYGYDRVLLAMNYMFEVGTKVSWPYFVKNCGTILNYYDGVQRDIAERQERARIMEEWLK